MLRAMRSRAGSLMAKILLGLLVVSFAVWGIEDMLRPDRSNDPVARVGNIEIGQAQFRQALDRNIEALRSSLGESFSPAFIKNLDLGQHTLDKLITDALLRQEAERLGILPSDRDVARWIRSDGIFQNDQGVFDKAVFEATLRRMHVSEKEFAEQIRHGLAASAIMGTVAGHPPVSDSLVALLQRIQNEERIAQLVIISKAVIAPPKPDDNAIRQYYEAHATDFSAPEYRILSYVTFSAQDMAKTQQISNEAIEAAYRERIDEFRRSDPPSIAPLAEVREALSADLKKIAAEEALYKTAGQLEDALAGGSTLAEAAAQFGLAAKTVGPVNREGKAPDGSSPKELPGITNFLDVAFALEQEKTESPLTLTREGTYFLVRTESITPERTRTLDEVRGQVTQAWEKQERKTLLGEKAREIAAALAKPETRAQALKAGKLHTVTTGEIRRNETRDRASLLTPALTEAIFTLAPGQAGAAYPLENGDFAVAILTRIIPAPPVDEKNNGDMAELRRMLGGVHKLEIQEQYMRYLRQRHPVNVNEELARALADRS